MYASTTFRARSVQNPRSSHARPSRVLRPLLLAQHTTTTKAKRRVLFVCGHNAGRSIAAETIARQLRPDLDIASCGTTPSGRINPVVLEALQSRGYDTTNLTSKSLDAFSGGYGAFDMVVTMGCLAEPPRDIPATTRYDDWGLPDPAKDASVVPMIIKEIERRVMEL